MKLIGFEAGEAYRLDPRLTPVLTPGGNRQGPPVVQVHQFPLMDWGFTWAGACRAIDDAGLLIPHQGALLLLSQPAAG